MLSIGLEVDEAFNDSEIKLLEILKQSLTKEYCKEIKQTVQDETMKSQFELQNKLSKCQMPSYEDLQTLKTLERAKIMMINKIEKIQESQNIDEVQNQVDEISSYIERIDDQIQDIITKYEKRPKTLLQQFEAKVKNAQYSEYNPMITPLKIDKAFQSFQNSHRILQNQSQTQNLIDQSHVVELEPQIIRRNFGQKEAQELISENEILNQSPQYKMTQLDNDLKDLLSQNKDDQMLDEDYHNDQDQITYGNILQVQQDFKLQDLDDTDLNVQNQDQKYENSYQDNDQLEQIHDKADEDNHKEQKKDESTSQPFNMSVCIQSKKMDEVQVSTQGGKPRSVVKTNLITKDQSKPSIKNKENSKQASNRPQSKQTNSTTTTTQRDQSKSSINRQSVKTQATSKNSAAPVTKPLTTNNNSTSQSRVSTFDSKAKAKQSQEEGKDTAKAPPRRDQTRERSQNQNNRNISVPKLQLHNLEQSQTKETFLGFTIVNKNLIEVENKQGNFSGLLSPINLKQSDRDISSKLDELYKSYETKEKVFGFTLGNANGGGGQNKTRPSLLNEADNQDNYCQIKDRLFEKVNGLTQAKPSLLNQSLLDDDVLLNDSRDEIRYDSNINMMMESNRDVQKEPDLSKETPLRKGTTYRTFTEIMEKRSSKRKHDKISNEEEEKEAPVIKQENTKKIKKNPDDQQPVSVDKGSNNKMQRIILWFRNDLRLHDNVILNYAVTKETKNKQIIPVFCFDPRFYGRKVQKYDTLKTGLVRQRFLLETVQNFRDRLEKVGSKLLVSMDKPEEFLHTLIDENCDNTIVYQEEICSEELAVEKLVKEKCKKAQIQSFWGSTLYHIDDLPFHPNELPHIYGKFREKTEGVKVRKLFGQPKKDQLPFIEDKPTKSIQKACEFMPTLEDFGFTKAEIDVPKDKRACYDFVGGEEPATNRLREYIFETKAVGNYALTRNQLIGANYSSKFSPWLACGALSPRYIYFQVKEFEEKHRSNESTKIFLDELFWRDFNRFWCMKYGSKVFSSYGIYDREYYAWNTDKETVKRWRQGNTGMPIIDALMREMNVTGFMPNRGRMIVACYLAMDLKQDWREGAYHFEEKLIDHDVQSNYGGWSFSAGIGPGRVLVFNSVKQSKDHDKNGDYIKMWVPELKKVPAEYIHEPWLMPKDLQKACKVIIGEDYPLPINCSKYTNKVAHSIEKEVRKAKSAERSQQLKQTKLKK